MAEGDRPASRPIASSVSASSSAEASPCPAASSSAALRNTTTASSGVTRSENATRVSFPGTARAGQTRPRRNGAHIAGDCPPPSIPTGTRTRTTGGFSGSPAGCAVERHPEQGGDGEREHPPPVRPLVSDDEDERDGDGDAEGDTPVVADDEVVPELPESADLLHATAPVRPTRSWRRRSAIVSRALTRRT